MSLQTQTTMYLFVSPVMYYCHLENKTMWINFILLKWNLLKKVDALIANSKVPVVRFLGLLKYLHTSNKWVISANCWELLLKFLKELWITCVTYGVKKSHHLHISEDSLINSNKEIKVVWWGLRQKLKIKIDLQNFRSLLASKEIN